MSTSIQLEFTFDQNNLVEDLIEKSARNRNYDCIEIANVPTVESGLEFIFKNLYDVIIAPQNVFGIIFKINEKIDENFNFMPRSSDFSDKTSFLVAFQSTIRNFGAKIYWKSAENDNFKSITVDGNITEKMCDFLIQEIQDGRSGLMRIRPEKKKIRLHEIGDSQGRNLLNIAVTNSQSDFVCNLLNYDFVPDDVIDLAWNLYDSPDVNQKQIRSQIVLVLLKANSRLPNSFEYDKASEDIQRFIDLCESFQKDVDNEDLSSLQAKLDNNPTLSCFYDRTNQSLLAYAIKANKTAVFKKFARRLNTGSHEDINRIYQTIQITDKRMMRKRREENPYNFPQTHLLVLKSKSRISSNDQNANIHWEYIVEAYKTINSIEYCSKILQVAAECKSFNIFFDFKHDSTYYLDPATSVNSFGIIYEGGTIYIGAQDLLNDESKFKVFGVIVHEMCHLAVYMGFMNRNFDPFPTGESELKRRFVDRVMVQCRQNQALDPIVGNVFRSYNEDVQDSEMIVTYPQILMQYFGNETKVEQFERDFNELVKYSKEVVEPELDSALNVLKLLNDQNYIIKYQNLTEPMKARILHSKILLQGVETTLFELIGSDVELLKSLTSNDIRKILLKHQPIELGEAISLNMDYGIIPRNFEKVLDKNQENQNDEGPSRKKRKVKKPKTELRTFEQIRDETNISKVFLLADHAGSGKTTIFKDCTKKLKEFNKNSWVSFINLRKYGKVFEQYKNKGNSLTLDDITKILQQIINPKSNIEASIYNKLFQEGRVIFLFDGVDEISPIYTELLLKIFTILSQMKPKNEMWISTRPHYAEKLSATLNIPYHKFTQYKSSEINNFIKEMLKFHGITNENQQEENLLKINDCLKGLKGFYYESGVSKEIENPLMVQMVTELYIQKFINADNISRYGVYEAMIEKQKEKVGEKIPNLERDKDFVLSIWDVHRVLGLILLIGDDYNNELKFKLGKLKIMQKWEEEKHKWTSDMIQRYGFVIVDLSNENVDRSSIDFMHRTYAEFFVAQIFANFITNDNREIYNDSKLISLLFTIVNRRKKFNIVIDFLKSFIKDKSSKNEKVYLEKIREVYSNEVQEIREMGFKENFLTALIKFAKKYANADNLLFDSKTLNDLWKLDKKSNLLEEYFESNEMKHNSKILEAAEESFGSSWHEKFNKRGTNLITDGEISKLKGNYSEFGTVRSLVDSKWNEIKNILKFCDLLDKNYEIEDRKKFYSKRGCPIYLPRDFFVGVINEIISRAHNTLDRETFCEVFLLKAYLKGINIENIKHIVTIIENDFINDEISLQKLLFESPERSQSPLCQDLGKEIFSLIKDFYIKHKNSWKDIQDILVEVDTKNFFKPVISSSHSGFKELVKDAFGTDFSRLAVKIEEFANNGGKFRIYVREDLKDLLNLIFQNDTEKVTNLIDKIFDFI